MVAAGVVAVLVVAVVVVSVLPTFRDRDTSNLGDDVYDISASTVRARSPLLLNDLAGGERALWVTHVGDDEVTGYHAFAAVASDGCLVTLDRDTLDLIDSCDGLVVPPDGAGQERFPVTYDDGRLIIDLNFADRDTG